MTAQEQILSLIAKLDNKQLSELSKAITAQRKVNTEAKKAEREAKKAEREATKAAKLKELQRASAPLAETIGTGRDDLFEERLAKAKKTILALILKDDMTAEELKKAKVAELRNALRVIHKAAQKANIAEAKAQRKAKAA